MATKVFKVEAPDGSIIKVEGDVNSDPKAITDFAQQQWERKTSAEGINLRPFGVDTGVELPRGGAEFLAGMGERMQQIGTLGTADQDKETKRRLGQSGYATAGAIGADLAALAPLGAAGVAGRAITAPRTLAQAIGGGAAYGAATSPDRVTGAALGAVGGAAGRGVQKVGEGLARVVKPVVREGVERMRGTGQLLTPGEALGGAAQRVEDAMTSLPYIGDTIIEAKERSLHGYNKATLNKMLSKVGEKLDDTTPAGYEAMGEAQEKVSKKFTDVLGDADFKFDDQFSKSFADINKNLMGEDAGLIKRIQNQVNIAFRDIRDGTMDGDSLKQAYSTLTKRIKSDASQGPERAYLTEIRDSLIDATRRQNPQWADKYKNVNAAYAELTTLEKAAGMAGADELGGVFSPTQVMQKIRQQSSKTAEGRKALARGEAFGQADAVTAKQVMQPKIPTSGTTERAQMTGLLGHGAGGLLNALAGGAYSPGASQRLIDAILQRPAGAAQAASVVRGAGQAGARGALPLVLSLQD